MFELERNRTELGSFFEQLGVLTRLTEYLVASMQDSRFETHNKHTLTHTHTHLLTAYTRPNTHAAWRLLLCSLFLVVAQLNSVSNKPNQDRVSIVQGGYVSSSGNNSLSVSKKANILNKASASRGGGGLASGNHSSANNNESHDGGAPAAIFSVSSGTRQLS